MANEEVTIEVLDGTENLKMDKLPYQARAIQNQRPEAPSRATKISDILMMRLRKTLGNNASSPRAGILSQENSSSIRSPTANMISDQFESQRLLDVDSNIL